MARPSLAFLLPVKPTPRHIYYKNRANFPISFLDARPAHSEPAYELIQSRWPAVDVLAMELLGTPGGLSGEAISAIIEAAGFEPLADLWMERRAELADDG